MALSPLAKAQDGNVILPPDAIDAMEIENEAGAAQTLEEGGDFLGNINLEVVAMSTIIAPTSGYVLAIGSGQLRVFGQSAAFILEELGVSDDCDASPSPANAQTILIKLVAPNPEIDFVLPFSTQKIYPVSAGAQMFCIVAISGVSDRTQLERMSLSLMFIPTAYGTVEQN